ncbi:MAG: translocation/assembly module TamB domain-containing protein [Rubellimicrobium sp.]|nr:translocation/assembly module TamB domain-containing protein [Rubellimicrobium sp.]
MARLLQLALVVLVLLVPPGVVAQTADEERDSNFLSRQIEDALSTVSRTVQIDGFRGALSSRATMTSLTMADEEGVWLRAEGLVLDWNRAALLRGNLSVRELAAERITLLRTPIAEPAPPSPEAAPFALPELPLSIQIGAMRIEELVLEAPVLGRQVILSIEGMAELDGGEGQTQLTAQRLDGAEGSFVLDAGYSNSTRILDLNLVVDEAADGLAARFLGIPGRPELRLELAGTGPIDDYTATLTLATDGVTRLTGEAGLVTVPGPEGTEPGQDFRLAVEGDLSAVTEPAFHPFFGSQSRIELQGGRDGEGRLTLQTLRLETASFDLGGQAVIAPDGWPEELRLQGRIAAADGGPVVLPVGGGETSVDEVELDLSFDAAQGDAWSGSFVVSGLSRPGLVLPVLTLSGGGVIVPAGAEGAGRFTAALDYNAEGLTLEDAALSEAVGSAITGEIRLSRAGDDPLRIERLTLSGPGLTLSAEGSVSGGADRFLIDSSILLSAEDASRFAPLTGLDLGGAAEVTIVSSLQPFDGIFDVLVTGGTRDLAFGIDPLDALLAGEGRITIAAARDEGGARIPVLDIATDGVRITGSADVTSGESKAVFALTLPDVGLALPDLAGPATLQGQAARDAEGRVALSAQASLPGTDLRIEVQGDDPDGPLLAEIAAGIDDLSAFAALVDRPLSGAAEARVTGSLAPDASTLDLTLSATTRDLAIGLREVDLLLVGPSSLNAQLIREGPETFRLEGLALETGALGLTGSARAEGAARSAVFDARLADIAPFVEGLTGPVTLSGSAAQSADGTVVLDLAAGHAGAVARVDGRLTPPEAGLAFDGRLDADVPELSAFAAVTLPLLGQAPSGAVAVDLSGMVRADLSLFDLDVAGTTGDLRTGIAPLDPLLAGPGSFALRATRSAPDEIVVEDLRLQTPQLSASLDGQLDARGGAAELAVTVSDVSPIVPGLSGPARLAGTATLDAEDRGTLDLSVSAPGVTATVSAAIAEADAGRETTLQLVAEAQNLAILSPLAGRPLSGSAGATVTGSLMPDGSAFDLAVAARATNPDPGIPAVATLLRGSGTLDARLLRTGGSGLSIEGLRLAFPNLTFNGDLSGRDFAGRATFDARLTDVGLFAPEFPGPLTATGTATLDAAGNWQISTDANGPGGTTLRATGIVAGPGALNLSLTGTAPLGLANGLIDPRRIEGRAGFDLQLVGAAAPENLSGTVTLSQGRFADPLLREALSDIAGTITLGGGRAQLQLGASVETGGRLEIEGPIGLAAPFVAELAVTGRNVGLRDPALFSTTADAAIRVTGPLAGGALIAGTVDLGVVELRIPSSPVGALGTLPEVRHIAPTRPVVETLARAGLGVDGRDVDAGDGGRGGGSGAFRLDVTIRAPSRVFIRGRGLDAELGGEFSIGGTTALPIPTGGLELIRGRLDILNQRFDLTEGSITVVGDFVPFLRLVARTTARTGTVVDVTVEGPASAPEVTFRSQPELPEDEIMAQLIFGRDLSQISPLQAVQLASAVATLAGRGGGFVDGIRDQLGIDDLDIAADGDGNAALRLGAYLSENVYTDVTVGTTQTQIDLNLDLTDDITVRGGVSSTGETSLGIFFERDY